MEPVMICQKQFFTSPQVIEERGCNLESLHKMIYLLKVTIVSSYHFLKCIVHLLCKGVSRV